MICQRVTSLPKAVLLVFLDSRWHSGYVSEGTSQRAPTIKHICVQRWMRAHFQLRAFVIRGSRRPSQSVSSGLGQTAVGRRERAPCTRAREYTADEALVVDAAARITNMTNCTKQQT